MNNEIWYKKYLFLGIVLFIGIYIGIIWVKREIWTGFYYSDIDRIDDQRTWVISPPLYSLEECRKWVNTIRKPEEDNYDYSCGQGCRFTTKLYGETMICRTDAR